MTEADLIEYARRSGYVAQSIEAIKPKLHRWVRHLRARGISVVPTLTNRAQIQRWEYARACNEINRLLSQDAKSSNAHDLRNLTGVRPISAEEGQAHHPQSRRRSCL